VMTVLLKDALIWIIGRFLYFAAWAADLL